MVISQPVFAFPPIFSGGAGTGVTDGDKGDITVSGSGAAYAVDSGAVAVSELGGAGTGVLTALAIDIGTAGAPVVLDGAGGTPSAITLTNGTGLPVSTGVDGLGANVATALAEDIDSANGLAKTSTVSSTYAPLSNATFTGSHFIPSFAGTALATAPLVPVAGTWYLADNEVAGWDPCTVDGTANYWTVWDGASYKAIIDEDGGLLIGSVDAAAGLLIGSTGVKISSDNDGALTFLGASGGSDEDLTINLDDTADTAVISTSTGVTKIDLSAIGTATTGVSTHGVPTPVIDDPDNFAANFTGANFYGGTFISNVAGTAALPEPAVGMNFTVVLEGAVATIIDPLGTGTADTIYMNGLAATADENITSSTSGAICYFQYRSANAWMATCLNFAEATP